MSNDIDGVEVANEELYAAFEAGDLDRMTALWVGGADGVMARCVHPGGGFIRGVDAVLRSWALVMANADDLQFIVTDVESVVQGQMATVTCTEIILRPGGGLDPFTSSQAVATNGFIRVSDQWRMWLHHASPVMSDSGRGDDE
ncbi:MAG: nuclear transport factor 2 family protein [Actinomycetia bacterium]|nr:nuclear transport factor 2 family protein [Actinomycetes bacterium]